MDGHERPNTKLYLFDIGDMIDPNYTVISHLGRGGYGEIYKARRASDGLVVAVKVEKLNKSGNLIQEIRVLKILQDCGTRHIPRLLAAGCYLGITYMVMELLGQNISMYRNHRTSLVFTLRCTCVLAILMLKAIKQVHDHGFLHRDIKPTNFVIGSFKNRREVFIIDFGLSRQYVRPDGTLIARQPRSGWAGSWRYMSPNTHLQKDHGRRDDMWGFLYVIIEFYSGTLPWRSVKGPKNVDRIRDIKLAYMNERLTHNLPDEFTLILNHIKMLSFESRPNYRYLHRLLMDMYIREGGTKDAIRYDWEDDTAGPEDFGLSVNCVRISFSSVWSAGSTSRDTRRSGMPFLQAEGDDDQLMAIMPPQDVDRSGDVFVDSQVNRLLEGPVNIIEGGEPPPGDARQNNNYQADRNMKKKSRYKRWKSKLKHRLQCHVQ